MCHSPFAVFLLGSQKQVTPTIPRGMTFFLFTGMKQVMKTAEDSSTISALRGCKHRVTEAKDTEYIFTLSIQENSEHARRHQQHLRDVPLCVWVVQSTVCQQEGAGR